MKYILSRKVNDFLEFHRPHPTILSDQDLEKLLSKIHKAYKFHIIYKDEDKIQQAIIGQSVWHKSKSEIVLGQEVIISLPLMIEWYARIMNLKGRHHISFRASVFDHNISETTILGKKVIKNEKRFLVFRALNWALEEFTDFKEKIVYFSVPVKYIELEEKGKEVRLVAYQNEVSEALLALPNVKLKDYDRI